MASKRSHQNAELSQDSQKQHKKSKARDSMTSTKILNSSEYVQPISKQADGFATHEKLNRFSHELIDLLSTQTSRADLVRLVGEEVTQRIVDLKGRLNESKFCSANQEPKGNDLQPVQGNGNGIHPKASETRVRDERGRPELPKIFDSALERAVFTHAAFIKGAGDFHNSYERLEFLGDAYLEIFASRIIYTMFPTVSPGRLSAIRETLVKNSTLADFSKMYGFELATPGNGTSLPLKSQTQEKVLSDVFEAYVAALVLSDKAHGEERAESWMRELWVDKLRIAKDTYSKAYQIDPKSILAQKLIGKTAKLDYRILEQVNPKRFQGGGHQFLVGVYLTGWGWNNELLGSGRGLNKGEAGSVAAQTALSNEDLMEKILAAKRKIDAENKARNRAPS